MVSMKTTIDSYGEPEGTSEYGYGLRLCLNTEQVMNLGLKKPLKAGTRVKFSGYAFVVTTTESVGDGDGDEDEDGNERNMDLQVTDLELMSAKSSDETAKGLYPDQN